jgi:hypothetical protein
MAKIKRFAGNTSGKNDYKMMAVGMCIGALIMFLYLGPQDVVEVQSSVAVKRTLGRQPPPPSSDTDGWHPINVFYGDVSGLKTGDKQWFSQVNQDRIIVDLLGTDGYFMDLAANEAVEYSNTLALERQGWNGLCIEPNPTYWYGLSHRKCTVVGALLGDNVDKVQVKFRGVYGGIVGKMADKMANRKKEPEALVEDRYTAPIKDVLKRFNVPKTIDYLSLDIEGAEYLVMKNFPFDEYSIKVLTVERPNKELKLLLESNGYIMVKSLAWWGETLWVHTSTGFTADHPKIAKIKEEGK